MSVLYNHYDPKYLNKENLLVNDQFVQDAQQFLVSVKAMMLKTWLTERRGGTFMEHFRYQNKRGNCIT